MTSTLSIGIFDARTWHPFNVTLQDDIQRDRIVSYLAKFPKSAASPNGLSLISSFLKFLHPFITCIIPLSLSPANAIESISSCFAYFPIYMKTLSVRRPDIDKRCNPLHSRTIAPKPSSNGWLVTTSGFPGSRIQSLNRVKFGQFLATVTSAALVIW
ncbi:Os04g0395651 [Oryza sativa Japonica Group]|uniref:Os04g0395651 protein n=1 Tax=Oryza sativa subsp. japonica TaxID=39947 RepID=A0A0N7KIZ6_ORYSJ|nr:Os04g0395651 [Oryza sativa Japonica Group]